MKQEERSSSSFFLVMNAHAVDISEVAVFRVWNAGPNLVKRNVCGAREPKDGQSYRRNHKQRDQNLQKLFHYSTDLRVLELKLIELISYHVRAGASPPSQPARFSCRLCLLYVENLSNQKEVLQLSEALGMEGGLAPTLGYGSSFFKRACSFSGAINRHASCT